MARFLTRKRLKSWERGLSDPKHPLETPRKFGPDRSTLVPRKSSSDKPGVRLYYGYIAPANFWEGTNAPIVTWGVGGIQVSATISPATSVTYTFGSGG